MNYCLTVTLVFSFRPLKIEDKLVKCWHNYVLLQIVRKK